MRTKSRKTSDKKYPDAIPLKAASTCIEPFFVFGPRILSLGPPCLSLGPPNDIEKPRREEGGSIAEHGGGGLGGGARELGTILRGSWPRHFNFHWRARRGGGCVSLGPTHRMDGVERDEQTESAHSKCHGGWSACCRARGVRREWGKGRRVRVVGGCRRRAGARSAKVGRAGLF